MSDRFEVLSQLAKALENFLQSGWQSQGSGNVDDPHGGMDPDELLVESVEDGGEIHNAVCSLQPFYGGKLPAPEARNLWLELQRACRHETDEFKRQIDAHKYAGQLQDWAKSESHTPEQSRDEQIRHLSDAPREAIVGFDYAEHKSGNRLTGRQAYDWLMESELAPNSDFEAWERALRRARKTLGEQKNKPRGGRGGRSIVKGHEVEYQHDNEDSPSQE